MVISYHIVVGGAAHGVLIDRSKAERAQRVSHEGEEYPVRRPVRSPICDAVSTERCQARTRRFRRIPWLHRRNQIRGGGHSIRR